VFLGICLGVHPFQEDEMSRPCSTNGGEEEYWWETQKERGHWEDQDVGGWTILKLILER
jgi:hypothetical protein